MRTLWITEAFAWSLALSCDSCLSATLILDGEVLKVAPFVLDGVRTVASMMSNEYRDVAWAPESAARFLAGA
jgi:hypothetical protein